MIWTKVPSAHFFSLAHKDRTSEQPNKPINNPIRGKIKENTSHISERANLKNKSWERYTAKPGSNANVYMGSSWMEM
jgi:hypothetical protein